MIITLNKAEKAVLKALDPKGGGSRVWQKAKELAVVVYRKKAVDQGHIRGVRNGLRKPVREGLVEMSATERGMYRISDRGRKIMAKGEDQFNSAFDRGQAVEGAKKQAAARMKAAPKAKPKKKAKAKTAKKVTTKAKPKKAAKKIKAKPKVAKKAAPKKAKAAKPKVAKKAKAAPKKAKAVKKAAPKKDMAQTTPVIAVEDKTKGNGTGNNEGKRKPPTFKRRKVQTSFGSEA